jgi:hypothetical protein
MKNTKTLTLNIQSMTSFWLECDSMQNGQLVSYVGLVRDTRTTPDKNSTLGGSLMPAHEYFLMA